MRLRRMRSMYHSLPTTEASPTPKRVAGAFPVHSARKLGKAIAQHVLPRSRTPATWEWIDFRVAQTVRMPNIQQVWLGLLRFTRR